MEKEMDMNGGEMTAWMGSGEAWRRWRDRDWSRSECRVRRRIARGSRVAPRKSNVRRSSTCFCIAACSLLEVPGRPTFIFFSALRLFKLVFRKSFSVFSSVSPPRCCEKYMAVRSWWQNFSLTKYTISPYELAAMGLIINTEFVLLHLIAAVCSPTTRWPPNDTIMTSVFTRGISHAIHGPLPLDPAKTKRLLAALTASFQRHLDAAHPTPSTPPPSVSASPRSPTAANPATSRPRPSCAGCKPCFSRTIPAPSPSKHVSRRLSSGRPRPRCAT
jgi:hypothetical protein